MGIHFAAPWLYLGFVSCAKEEHVMAQDIVWLKPLQSRTCTIACWTIGKRHLKRVAWATVHCILGLRMDSLDMYIDNELLPRQCSMFTLTSGVA